MPLNAIVELTSLCQLACPLCRTGKALRERYPDVPRGIMDRSTFKNILFKLPAIREMLLYNWGEPFLNPDLLWFVLFAKKMAQKVHLSTNMQSMSVRIAEGLVRSRLDTVVVSCDGISQESYGSYRTGGVLNLVLSNVRLLTEVKERLGSVTPEIVFQCIVTRFNEHEIDRYESFAKKHGANSVRLIPLSFLTPEGFELLSELEPKTVHYKPVRNLGTIRNCPEPWQTMAFDWNGDVYPCCNPSGIREYSLGNINTATFDEIVDSPKFSCLRRFCESAEPEQNDHKLMCYACYGKYPSKEVFQQDMWHKCLQPYMEGKSDVLG